jgi:hypothetical protein
MISVNSHNIARVRKKCMDMQNIYNDYLKELDFWIFIHHKSIINMKVTVLSQKVIKYLNNKHLTEIYIKYNILCLKWN